MNGQASGATAAITVSRRAVWFRWTLANAVGWGLGGIAARVTAALLGTTVAATTGTAVAALKRGGGPETLLFALLAAVVVVAAVGAGGAVMGAIVGALQARVVGPHLRSSVNWVAATIEGTAVAMLLAVLVTPVMGLALRLAGEPLHRALSQPFLPSVIATHPVQVLAWTITGGVVGLFVGRAQRFAFSKEWRCAARWTVANLVAWSLAGLPAAVSAAPTTLDQFFASGWELQRILNNLPGLVLFGVVGGTVGGGITGTVLVAAAPNAGQMNTAGGERRSGCN